MKDRVSITELSRQIESDLAALARRIHEDMFGAGAEVPAAIPVRLELALPTAGPADGSLAAQVARDVREASSRGAVFVAGHVYCYRCESARCEHGLPPHCRSVSAGYGPTGQPRWSDLSQVFVEAHHERVEDLFGLASPALALVQTGRELKQRLLHPFGKASKRYDLLGQVVAGYFRGDSGIFAVTVQAIETRGTDGRRHLALNRIGPEAGRYFDEHPEHWFPAALSAARAKLAQIEGAPDRMPRVPAVLHDLRRAIERAGRQSGRRTQHAEERRRDNRPTHAAIRDAWKAPDAAMLADESRGTLIVLGPNGRAHAFTPDGRHVTSLTLERDALERRIGTQRWRRATREEIRALREALPRRSA